MISEATRQVVLLHPRQVNHFHVTDENITSVHKDLNNFLSHHFCFLPGTYILYRYYIRPCFTMIPPGFNEVRCMWYVSFVLLTAFGTILDWDRHSECQPL